MWAWTHNDDDAINSSTDHYNDGKFVSLTGSTDMTNSMPPYLAVYMWKRTAQRRAITDIYAGLEALPLAFCTSIKNPPAA